MTNQRSVFFLEISLSPFRFKIRSFCSGYHIKWIGWLRESLIITIDMELKFNSSVSQLLKNRHKYGTKIMKAIISWIVTYALPPSQARVSHHRHKYGTFSVPKWPFLYTKMTVPVRLIRSGKMTIVMNLSVWN